MVRLRPYFLLLITIVSLAACSQAGTTALPAETGQPLSPTATPLPPTPTSSPPPPTATEVPPTATASSTPTIPPPSKTPRPTKTPLQPLSGSGGGVLAFVRAKENSWGIYVMNADGSQQRRILFHGEALAYPEWSPDGSKILFHKHQSDDVVSINVMDADGSNEVRLTEGEHYDSAPFWSPDGQQIVFSRDEDIWVMDADGENPRLLMDDPAASNGPEYSPDGSKILIESSRDGNTEIYVMDADGTNPQRLTNNKAEDWWPTWSPDGSQIAFMSTLDGDWEIYVMDADGGNLRQLTENEFNDRGPAWSPDGSRIAFATNRDSGQLNDTEVYIMNSDGSEPVRVLEKVGFEWGVDWRWVDPVGTAAVDDPTTAMVELKDLQLTIIYDNTTVDEGLTPEWGFGALIEYDGHTVLFDTGGSNTFMDNMHALGIDPMVVEAVVLSHEHGDHTGGLHGFLSEADQPVVYLLDGFSSSFKNGVRGRTEVVEVSSSMEIFPGIYTTGQISGGGVYEQGLAIDLGNEIVIITGCAHPGVVRMTRRGRSAVQPGSDVEYKPVALVIGGFHLMGASRSQVEGIIQDLRELGVKLVAPTHCTGEEIIAIFAEILGDDYLLGGAGTVIKLP